MSRRTTPHRLSDALRGYAIGHRRTDEIRVPVALLEDAAAALAARESFGGLTDDGVTRLISLYNVMTKARR